MGYTAKPYILIDDNERELYAIVAIFNMKGPCYSRLFAEWRGCFVIVDDLIILQKIKKI